MVKVENISFSYSRSRGKVLDAVGFCAEPGECMAILGNNGAGKSTLLKCMDRICPTQGGTVLVENSDVFKMSSRQMAQNIAYVPQNGQAAEMTVFDTVLLGRRPYITWDVTEEDRMIVAQVIHQMGLDDYILRSMAELSGGEAQKVMLARALAQQPKLLLLDEPTSNLDPRNQHEVMRTVRRVVREKQISAAIIIHDLNLAARYCDRFLFLKDSQVYACGGPEIITEETIQQVYGMPAEILEHRGFKMIVPI